MEEGEAYSRAPAAVHSGIPNLDTLEPPSCHEPSPKRVSDRSAGALQVGPRRLWLRRRCSHPQNQGGGELPPLLLQPHGSPLLRSALTQLISSR
ncbi:hypothetical protein Pyn_01626 [Prunus yedoensis var. nudiflora]|uniref:Uncharacterized protein n=1 Tax=Prunus yedoensis var. nudiflora TaxID=2094558 RepID=A0A314YL06_PRUYE|nr:hypothetical protein Pyn_01626 [Prunus yedoensis var. nudiflora]